MMKSRGNQNDTGAEKNHKKNYQSEHPSLDIVSTEGNELHGKRIILCISGSVAAYKAIELARLLMRHGCRNVTCVASKAATKLIRPAYLKWATGNDVITELTGSLEHIKLADYGMSDLVIVYPATANTIGKLANGIDDAPVSTMLTVALGSDTPIVICPAMHESMYENPAVARNIAFLTGRGITFVGPHTVAGKARASEPEEVLERVIAMTGSESGSALMGKRVLLVAGPTIEHIDPVRAITNRSSGRTGVLLAARLVESGASVNMIYGPGKENPPNGAHVTRIETSAEMLEAVHAALKDTRFDVVIMAAAVSDYTPVGKRRRTKIKSGPDFITIRLKKVPKIINMVKKMQPGAFLVGFKAEANITEGRLVASARKKMAACGADMIIANDIGDRYRGGADMNNVIIITPESLPGVMAESGWCKKDEVVKTITGAIERGMADHNGQEDTGIS